MVVEVNVQTARWQGNVVAKSSDGDGWSTEAGSGSMRRLCSDN